MTSSHPQGRGGHLKIEYWVSCSLVHFGIVWSERHLELNVFGHTHKLSEYIGALTLNPKLTAFPICTLLYIYPAYTFAGHVLTTDNCHGGEVTCRMVIYTGNLPVNGC